MYKIKGNLKSVVVLFFVIFTSICNVLASDNSTKGDVTPPTISLLGEEKLKIYVGDTYVDPGVSVIDNKDGDISSYVIIGGDAVDTSTAGTYHITYNISDQAGNAATEVSRTVEVEQGILLGSEDWEGEMTTDVQPGGFYWSSLKLKENIIIDPEDSTNKVLKFVYKALNTTGDSDKEHWQEKKFQFSKPQKNLWISYRVYIPSNWKYRGDKDSGLNNKGFIVLWGGNYRDPDIHTRTEFWRIDEDTARISCAWHTENRKGTGGHSRMDSDGRYHPVGITAEDRGKWMDVVIHVKFSDKGKSNGAFEIWKNGSILASWRDLPNAKDDDSLVDGVNIGYFWGYHNSGYDEDTIYLFDDMKFGTSSQSIGFTIPGSEVEDKVSPVINLIGEKQIYITVGNDYEDPGVTATDNVDGNIAKEVIVGGDIVDTSRTGTYEVTYNVSDQAGNEATEVTRTIVVGDGILLGSENWENPMTTQVQNGGFYWNSTWGKISVDPTDNTNKVLNFTYKADTGKWQQKKFGFLNAQKEIWVKYRVYIPSNWKYRATGNAGTNNQGFIRLWGGKFSNPSSLTQTVFWRVDDNNARITSTWHTENRKGTGGHSRVDSDGKVHPIGITGEDRGKWMDVVMHTKLSDKGDSNGMFEIWKNGTLLASWRDLPNAPDDDAKVDGIDQGFFFGYHNTGYDEDTSYLFDNMKFGTTAQAIGFTIPDSEKDTKAPVIELLGEDSVYVTVGNTYTEQGVTANDNIDGDITNSVTIAGDTVDTSTAGTYTITYNVQDSAGNKAAEVTRKVIVGYGILLGSEDWEGEMSADVQDGGFYWSSTQGKISTDPENDTNKVLRFTYKAGDANMQEKRFGFIKPQKNIWVSYRLHIPSNWKYRGEKEGGSNNKGFINFWGGKYTDVDIHTRTEFWRVDENTARISCAWHTENKKGSGGHSRMDSDGRYHPVGITAEDRGKWMDVVIHVKFSDKGKSNGAFEIWKNGSILASWRDLPNAQDDDSLVDGVDQGYFFGWHNSGYDEDTSYLFDDMKFGTTAQAIGFNFE